MENKATILEKAVADLDYFFQEGVIFNQDELDRIWNCIKFLMKMARDIENPAFKQLQVK